MEMIHYSPKPKVLSLQGKKDKEGKVTTGPKNFLTNKIKKGATDNVLLSKPDYVTIGEPYKDASKLKMRDIKPSEHAVKHEKLFKPASPFFAGYTSYEHKTEGVKVAAKAKKGEDGKILIGPKNFYTKPCKESIGLYPEHQKEEYERLKKIKSEEWKKSKGKMPEKTFNPMIHGDKLFFNDQRTFGLDQPIPVRSKTAAVVKKEPLHEKPFKPSNPPKKGYNKTINAFPEYVHQGPKPRPQTHKKDEAKEEKAKWKMTHNNNISRHDPSIVSNFKNLKAEFNHAFH